MAQDLDHQVSADIAAPDDRGFEFFHGGFLRPCGK
jgi:hypothetical protein